MGLLEELAVRCEAATGADRELDQAIYEAIGSPKVSIKRPGTRGDDVCIWAPFYTASLDAAITLAPEVLFVTLIRDPGSIGYAGVAAHPDEVGNSCASLPLALTAASLRARHALALSKGSEG